MPNYAVTVARRGDGLTVATFPDVPDAVAVGRTFEEALAEAAKSLERVIRKRFLSGQELPIPKAEGPLRLHQDVLSTILA